MKWYIVTPYGQVWYPYLMESDLLFHPEGADTDMSDSTMEELLQMFGSLIVMANNEDSTR